MPDAQTIIVLFTAVTSIGVVIQAGVLLGMYFGARRALKKTHELANQMSTNVLPALANIRSLLEDISPKLKVISSNLVDTTHTLKHQTSHINNAVEEMVEKSRHQADRVDEMVTGTLDGITHATSALQDTISIPVRKVSGVLAGLRAGMSVLRSNQPSSRVYQRGAPTEGGFKSDSDDPGAFI